MVLQPDPPFPKIRGSAIRSEDWNETVNEVVRLDAAKLNQTGGTVSGNLAVTGTITGRLANGTVGQPQLADSAVTAGKIAPGSITVDRFQGGFYQTYTETGLDRYGFHMVVVQNRTSEPIQLHITSYIHGLSALPFQPT